MKEDAGWGGSASFSGKLFDSVVSVVSKVHQTKIHLFSLPESSHEIRLWHIWFVYVYG